jgi:hypothetical protein
LIPLPPPRWNTRRPRGGCGAAAHDGAELLRDALGQFICDVCDQPCEDESLDAGTEP